MQGVLKFRQSPGSGSSARLVSAALSNFQNRGARAANPRKVAGSRQANQSDTENEVA